ncbi:MAG: HAD family hydrolase [Candidatus Pacebacteria bacterium]|nr:HAD family hydrolase [Candidatus Paceibacterota bacterium]
MVLFDIDKTLLKSARGHHLSFSEAFKKVFEVDADIDMIEHDGMTDQQIITEILKKNGIAEEEIKSRMAYCTAVMVDYFNEVVKDEKIIILDGVPELLEELEKNNILIGLLTGNLEPIARAKLVKVGLNDYFKLGGFGSDDMSRAELVKIAMVRAKDKFNFNGSVFLVGDTPKDMEAGKAAGVKNIGVATGKYSMDQLKDAGANFVIPNLKNKEEFLNIIR